ncbi:hypothetical protein [Paraburkholderia terricola]|uniref:Uncharacterized protein n=1 Tax=Paraburkholderia terricola TaxID=169427 RepID=A0A1M6XLK9_9BURK|nr:MULTISPECIES: hypothetical protein [Paraburkholderia]SDP29531.1 hypothetical protein SAMN05192547_105723 [Paraburkholderia sediminicola]SHL06857.1 hypothetical protein SAMN05192548_105722 [Paraburkholderia terricola]
MPQDEENPLPARLAVATAAGRVSVTFRDKAFKSRTLVLADGRTLAVEKSTVTASDQEQLALLDRHPDFERVADGA